jgi:hypothetical protein
MLVVKLRLLLLLLEVVLVSLVPPAAADGGAPVYPQPQKRAHLHIDIHTVHE